MSGSGFGAACDAALACFDALPAVEAEELLGAWRGAGHPTGHPFDGALEAYGWWGKRFDSLDDVHPLVFRTWAGETRARPAWVAPGIPLLLRWPWMKSAPVAGLVRAVLPLVGTRRPLARVRMLRHRGVVTAVMLYDDVPILDVFRRLDADTLLGLMDCRGMHQPFFFRLRRERA